MFFKCYVQMFQCLLFLINLKVLTIVRIVLFLVELFCPSLRYSLFIRVCMSVSLCFRLQYISVLSISDSVSPFLLVLSKNFVSFSQSAPFDVNGNDLLL